MSMPVVVAICSIGVLMIFDSVDVRGVEHVQYVLVDPVELHELLIARHLRPALGLFAGVIL